MIPPSSGSFAQSFTGTWKGGGGHEAAGRCSGGNQGRRRGMDYGQLIVELLGKIAGEGMLKRIYGLAEYLYLRE